VFIHLCIPELDDDDKMLGGTLSILEDVSNFAKFVFAIFFDLASSR